MKPDCIYIVGVSGGVDSVVLLDFLIRKTKAHLIVAHLDHGIRSNSREDAQFVSDLARQHGLDCKIKQARLGQKASEAQARQARYDFFRELLVQHQATAVITAHHQDDLLETMIINFYRGSGRRGLTSLRSKDDLLRPLLHMSKQQILDYAQTHALEWRQDATNDNLKYLRNFIRYKIMSHLASDQRRQLLEIYHNLSQINKELDNYLNHYLKHKSYRRQGKVFARQWFNKLAKAEAYEIVATWLRLYKVPNYDQRQISYIVNKLRTIPSGKRIVVSAHQQIVLTKRSLRLEL